MKVTKLMLALAAVGAISAVNAEEQHPLLTAGSSTTLSGYVDTSAMYQVGNDTWGGSNGRVFDGPNKWDGFNLNVVKLTLEKPLDEGQWSAGYKVDLVFGPDADYYGALLNASGASAADDFAVKQAYAVARIPAGNGIDIKMGVFDTIIGYEVFESLNNPNYSRSYGYAIEPTHHTGVLASYHISDAISLSAGIANTYSGPINNRVNAGFGGPVDNEELTYMGSITLTLPEGAGPLAGSAIYAGIVDGIAGGTHMAGVATTKDTTSYYAGTTLATPWEAVNLGAAFDYQEDGVVVGGESYAWAAAGYASFGVSEGLKLNARGEYAKGSAGSFGLMNQSGRENEIVAATLTADYAVWTGLLTRLEGRWDRSLNGARYGAFGSKTDRNIITLALNMVYKF